MPGWLGGSALLAACGAEPTPTSQSPTTNPTSVPATVAPTRPASGAATATGGASTATRGAAPVATRATIAASPGAAAIQLSDSGFQPPAGAVTFQWLDNGDQKGVFFKELFAAYGRKYPNIAIEYNPLPGPEIAKIVPLGVQSGNAPDVFRNVSNFTPAEVVRSGRVQPLDDLIPNFAEWKRAFPFGAFLPGVSDFNGKTYFASFAPNRRQGNLLLFNTAQLGAAGYDPAAEPLTRDEFRAAAKKVTEAGKGQYYGLIIGGNTAAPRAGVVTALATMAGALGGEINWQTGQYNYAGDQFAAAIELLLALKAEGSSCHGSVSINAPQARAVRAGERGDDPARAVEHPDPGSARTRIPSLASVAHRCRTPPASRRSALRRAGPITTGSSPRARTPRSPATSSATPARRRGSGPGLPLSARRTTRFSPRRLSRSRSRRWSALRPTWRSGRYGSAPRSRRASRMSPW